MTLKPVENKEVYQVLNDLTVEVDVLNNPYDFQLGQLFQMAARINKNRSFLFVSKVLGKHLAVNPKIPLLVGSLLAIRYLEVVHGESDSRAQKIANAIQTNEGLEEIWGSLQKAPISLPKATTFVGFAETATALGHAVFSSFSNNAKYIHTTREQIESLTSIINFEEEHSHATSHRVYALDAEFFQDDSEVVLVDDEVTTGKTAINIIRTIKAEYPLKKEFTVVSILDWRTPEYRERYRQLEDELDVKIHTIALIDGVVSISGTPSTEEHETKTDHSFQPEVSYLPVSHLLSSDGLQQSSSTSVNGIPNKSSYLHATGRFGLSIEKEKAFSNQIQAVANYVKEKRRGKKTLVIGTGEFMYLPMHIAAQMGEGVSFHSTTRSPIYHTNSNNYTIWQKFTFDSPENQGVTNYLYNIQANQYDEVFIIFERMSSLDAASPLIEELARVNLPYINIVNMTEIVE
ncbi:phosphoribosyltransferase family protein [Ureibacillus chungkukjangi]|uniref:Phosphoribosyltransferase-like predicted ribonucleoside biosynthesis protein n=1 Tax=Ureibacillus chungkukjangi TaxID=1202712 RepID=A0A318TUK8_9BACL|nr:phosphoribosyltransferase family protein [Ureibacillus chungkukjangi]PYF08492.1 phosphoribosyltransferase-like predicted ribonucleoside biosynthesis protein [Ureibacillus chungkukjangi]